MTETLSNETNVLLRDERDGIVTLTLNRPKSGNSLSHGLVDALAAALDDIEQDDTARVVVIEAPGKLFCSGHDLNESLAARDDPESKRAANIACAAMMQHIQSLPKPVIAKVHGIATAAGCQLAASCDLVYASDVAKFATPGVNIGLWCLAPQVALSRAVAPKHAMEMLLTGQLVDAEHAFRIGLVNRVVPLDALDGAVREIAEQIAAKSAFALAQGKESFYRQRAMDLPGAYDYVSELIYRGMSSADAQEGISAFLEKRKPVWKGR